jgi:hypothetical protein
MTGDVGTSLSPSWQKAQAVSVIAASVAVPVIVAFAGNAFTQSQKNQELGVRYVELAVGILRAEPSKGNKALRSWAITVVDHFSPVHLPDEAKSELELDQLLIELQTSLQKQSELLKQKSDTSKAAHEKAMEAVRSIR